MNSSDTVTLTELQIRRVRESFSRYDDNNSGSIPITRLGDVMRSVGHDLDKDELLDLAKHVDTDANGSIEWDEFLPLMAAKVKEEEEISYYKDLFRMLDMKKRGYIMCEDLAGILRGLADEVELTELEIEEMITALDEDGNGQVSFHEFYKLMTTD